MAISDLGNSRVEQGFGNIVATPQAGPAHRQWHQPVQQQRFVQLGKPPKQAGKSEPP